MKIATKYKDVIENTFLFLFPVVMTIAWFKDWYAINNFALGVYVGRWLWKEW